METLKNIMQSGLPQWVFTLLLWGFIAYLFVSGGPDYSVPELLGYAGSAAIGFAFGGTVKSRIS